METLITFFGLLVGLVIVVGGGTLIALGVLYIMELFK